MLEDAIEKYQFAKLLLEDLGSADRDVHCGAVPNRKGIETKNGCYQDAFAQFVSAEKQLLMFTTASVSEFICKVFALAETGVPPDALASLKKEAEIHLQKEVSKRS